MNKKAVLVLSVMLGAVGTASSRAELHDRGNGLIYDDVLNITWLQNAKYGGNKKWKEAVEWAANLEYQGYGDWRLPSISVSSGVPTGATASPVDCSTATELECRDNELGYMYFHNLGGKGNQVLGNQGFIQNIQRVYWSGTESAGGAWEFTFNYGGMAEELKAFGYAVWAVRPGDVAK
ncbi:MAG: DUF1566 domain-containing protein [Acidiferrobacterales bacterium]|nr:DUF1566 domain-containing protein [Acidiferrobacterales bacterium]